MKTPLRLAVATAALLLLTSCSSPAPSTDEAKPRAESAAETIDAPAEVESLPFNARGLLFSTAEPKFEDGETGEVSVVQIGPLKKSGIGSVLLFAFRNNTDAAVSHVDWSATARADGAIVSTGSSQGTTPSVVGSGEVGLAYIYFQNGEAIPEDADYEFQVSTSPADTSSFNTAPMTVTEANLVGDAIVGSATNDTGEKTSGPYGVDIYCFDGDAIIGQLQGFTEQDELAPGAAGTFTVSLYGDSCPTYAVGVSGYYD